MSETASSVLELLSVELWREIFEYFTTKDLWCSFHGLNKKIDTIIDQTTLYLNFREQGTYNYFRKHILKLINVSNVRSLKFQKGNEVQHFFSKCCLNSLIQLRVLSLTFMYSFDDNLFTFWNQLSSLKYLRLLEIKLHHNLFHHSNCVAEKKFLIHSIFNKDYCPSLKSFIITTSGTEQGGASIPSLITTTKTTNIKYLSIDILTFNDLMKLLPALQNVQSFRIDYQLYHENEQPNQEMMSSMPLMCKCTQLNLKLSDKITFEQVECILKHTPNLKDIFLWGWYSLLNAKKWELLLTKLCPNLIKLQLICTGFDGNDDFDQAIDDFEQECQTTSFWQQRNVTITDEDYSGHDYRSDIVIRFNIEKSKQSGG